MYMVSRFLPKTVVRSWRRHLVHAWVRKAGMTPLSKIIDLPKIRVENEFAVTCESRNKQGQHEQLNGRALHARKLIFTLGRAGS